MKVFVTGGCGFIGCHVINALLIQGFEVIALRRFDSSPCIKLSAEPKWVLGDLAKCPVGAFDGCDALIHLAAAGVTDLNNWDECFSVNLDQSLALWQRAVRAGIHSFVIAGSCFEYGASALKYERIPVDAPLLPTAAYHASKASATMAACALAVEERLSIKILRPFHVYGEGEGATRFWPALRKAALAGEDFSMTYGEQIRDFTPVDIVASAFLNSLGNVGKAGEPEIKNIGTGISQSLRSFALYWWNEWSAKGKLRFGEINYRDGEIMHYVPEL